MLIGMIRAIYLPIVSANLVIALALAAAPTQLNPETPKADRHGDPLPAGAIARLGTLRFRGELARATDGKSMATLRRNRVVFVDLESGAERRELPGPNPTDLEVWTFVLSPDGRFIAYGGSGKIEVWDISGAKRIARFDCGVMEAGNSAEPMTGPIAFSPDCRLLLIRHYNPNYRAACWDFVHDEIRWQSECRPEENVYTRPIGWTGDGQFAVVMKHKERECHVVLVRTETGEAEHTFSLGQAGADTRAIGALAPDGREFVFFESSEKIRRIELPTGRALPQIPGSGGHEAVAFAYSPDGNRLAILDYFSVRVVDLTTNAEKGRSRNGPFFGYRECLAVYSPDGKSIWTMSHDERAWSLLDGTSGRSKRMPDNGHTKAISAIAISNDGKSVVTNCDLDAPRLWEAATGKSSVQLSPKEGIKSLVFHPDNKMIVGTMNDSKVYVWNAAKGRVDHHIRLRGEGSIHLVAVDRTGQLIAVAQETETPTGQEYSVRVCNYADGKERAKLTGLSSCPETLNFSPDSRFVAATSNSNDAAAGVVIFDIVGNRIHRTIPGDTFAAYFLPHGQALIYATNEGMTIWELSSGATRLHIDHPENEIIDVIAVSPDGHTLVGANNSAGSRRIHRWDLRTGDPLPPLFGHDHHITALAFANDGRLVSGSQDTTALVWAPRQEPIRSASTALNKTDDDSIWNDLRNDGESAHRAMERLIAAGDAAVAYCRKYLLPAKPVDDRHVDRLLERLDAPRFADRQRAANDLEALDMQVEPHLRRATTLGTSAEMRRSATRLLERLDGPVAGADLLRGLRGVEILQRIGTIEARTLLEQLATGDPTARLTRAAKTALQFTPQTHGGAN